MVNTEHRWTLPTAQAALRTEVADLDPPPGDKVHELQSNPATKAAMSSLRLARPFWQGLLRPCPTLAGARSASPGNLPGRDREAPHQQLGFHVKPDLRGHLSPPSADGSAGFTAAGSASRSGCGPHECCQGLPWCRCS